MPSNGEACRTIFGVTDSQFGALVAIHRRAARLFDALAGLGAAIKAWPIVLTIK